MTGDTVLHIGLHKTATRFLQRAVFRNLDADHFLYNPSEVLAPLRSALRDPHAEATRTLADAVQAVRARAGNRALVISAPEISGNMYNHHHNFTENLALVREVFPEARVIYFVRRHSDWLQSAYRQSLVKGRGIPIETFLNYYGGEFRHRMAPRVFGARNVDALQLQFLAIYTAYARTFGPERTYLFRQEDLRNRPEDVYGRLAEALGTPHLPALPNRVSANRAFSALAIDLFYPRVHLRRRPPESRDAGGRTLPIVRKLGKPWRKLRTALIRHVFDRLLYYDRDLLARGDMRRKLDAHYEHEHAVLTAIANEILNEGPGPTALAIAMEWKQRNERSPGTPRDGTGGPTRQLDVDDEDD